jgi:hypothetical protein
MYEQYKMNYILLPIKFLFWGKFLSSEIDIFLEIVLQYFHKDNEQCQILQEDFRERRLLKLSKIRWSLLILIGCKLYQEL